MFTKSGIIILLLPVLVWTQVTQDSRVNFILYTPTGHISLRNDTIDLLNTSLSSIFLIHGHFKSVRIDAYFRNITLAYRDTKDYNVVFVDWSPIASEPYETAVNDGIATVGEALGKMLLHLSNNGIRLKSVRLLGTSLGGHIAGVAGRYVQDNHSNNTSVYRITALDPSGYLIDDTIFENWLSLRSTDADIVDVTHSNSLRYGSDVDLGTIDFYVNGGQVQPSCGNLSDYNEFGQRAVHLCSHAFSLILYRLTIGKSDYHASSQQLQCEDVLVYGDLYNGNNNNITGQYFIQTQSEWPYHTIC